MNRCRSYWVLYKCCCDDGWFGKNQKAATLSGTANKGCITLSMSNCPEWNRVGSDQKCVNDEWWFLSEIKYWVCIIVSFVHFENIFVLLVFLVFWQICTNGSRFLVDSLPYILVVRRDLITSCPMGGILSSFWLFVFFHFVILFLSIFVFLSFVFLSFCLWVLYSLQAATSSPPVQWEAGGCYWGCSAFILLQLKISEYKNSKSQNLNLKISKSISEPL